MLARFCRCCRHWAKCARICRTLGRIRAQFGQVRPKLAEFGQTWQTSGHMLGRTCLRFGHFRTKSQPHQHRSNSAKFGLSRRKMAEVGHRWSKSAKIGRGQPNLVEAGQSWSSRPSVGRFRSELGFGSSCRSRSNFGRHRPRFGRIRRRAGRLAPNRPSPSQVLPTPNRCSAMRVPPIFHEWPNSDSVSLDLREHRREMADPKS